MPIVRGYSKKSIARNVKSETSRLTKRRAGSGATSDAVRAQAVAIALSVARAAWRRKHPFGPYPKHLRKP